jgi:hypothetical protein
MYYNFLIKKMPGKSINSHPKLYEEVRTKKYPGKKKKELYSYEKRKKRGKGE